MFSNSLVRVAGVTSAASEETSAASATKFSTFLSPAHRFYRVDTFTNFGDFDWEN
jgi:hypothetical protein